MKTIEAVVEQVTNLLLKSQQLDYVGEPISQYQHAMQCAALASAAGGSDEVIIAALLHDVGHWCFPDATPMADLGMEQHETLGAEFLFGLGFSARIADLVAGHVTAKRYLVTTRAEYRNNLSTASQRTLEFQGGLLTTEEVTEFERHEDFKLMLQLRAWDEAAKATDVTLDELSSYKTMLHTHLQSQSLTQSDLELFVSQGYLHLTDYFSARQIKWLYAQVNRLQELPDTAGKWMKYYEQGGEARKLCRIENFVPYQFELGHLILGPRINGLVSQLMGEEAVLFKEKINFKLPGGEGFAAHQDAPAFTSFGHDYHITTMLSFDRSNAANGCLEMVPGDWGNEILPMTEAKTIAREVVESLDWQPVETNPGDIVLFASYIPHRSAMNKSSQPRRALYATYNRASAGEVRQAYFEEKRRIFPPENERISGRDYSDSGVFNIGNPISK